MSYYPSNPQRKEVCTSLFPLPKDVFVLSFHPGDITNFHRFSTPWARIPSPSKRNGPRFGVGRSELEESTLWQLYFWSPLGCSWVLQNGEMVALKCPHEVVGWHEKDLWFLNVIGGYIIHVIPLEIVPRLGVFFSLRKRIKGNPWKS